MITIIAYVCLGLVCTEETVTSSRLDPTVTMQWCSNAAQPQLAAWMAEHFPGHTLAGWKCELGERKRST